MKAIKNILAATAITLSLAALTACTADEVTTPAGNPADAVTISTTLVTATRADGDVAPPAFTPPAGTELSLLYGGIDAEADKTAAYEYTADGKWSTTAPLYWNNLDATDGIGSNPAHFPFFAASPAVPVATPSVIANQSIEANYTASDQLIAYTATTQRRQELALTMRHVLSQITVSIASAKTDGSNLDISDEHITGATLTINGAKTSYTLTYSKDSDNPAVATATGDAAIINPLKATTAQPNLPVREGTSSFAAIVPTQTFVKEALTLTFTINGKTYTWTNKEEITLATGTRTHIDIKAAISSVLLGSVSVAPWADATNTTEGSINTDDVQIDGVIEGITEDGTLTVRVYKDGERIPNVSDHLTGNGKYTIIYNTGTSTATFDKMSTGYYPIKWAKLTDKEALYTYTVHFFPTANPTNNHNKDFLGGVSTPVTPWGIRPTISLSHLVSRLVVKLSCTDGTYDAAGINDATITVQRNKKVEGVLSSSTEVKAHIIDIANPDEATVTLLKEADATPATFSAILCPQTLMADGSPDTDVLTLTITTPSGVAKTYTMKKPVTLVAGQTHIVNAELSASSLVPDSITVNPWVDAPESDGSLEIQ